MDFPFYGLTIVAHKQFDPEESDNEEESNFHELLYPEPPSDEYPIITDSEESPCITCVQYIGGYQDGCGGYHEYIGGCSVHWGDIMSTSGDVQYIGDIMMHVGGYHEYIGGYHEYIGGYSVH